MASAEIYDIERDAWHDLQSPGRGCLVGRQRSPASSPWSAGWAVPAPRTHPPGSSGGGYYCEPGEEAGVSRRPDSSVRALWTHPTCVASEIEDAIANCDTRTALACNTLQQDVIDTAEMLRRYVNSSQTVLRQSRAEDCFNRAKIESLKTQLRAARSSLESHVTRHRELTCQRFDLVLTLVQESCMCAAEIAVAMQGERECINALAASEEQVREISKLCEQCQSQVIFLQSMWSNRLSGWDSVMVRLSEMVQISNEALEESESLKGDSLLLHTKILSLEDELSKHRLVVGAVWHELEAASRDTRGLLMSMGNLKERYIADLESRRTVIHCLGTITDDIVSCQQEVDHLRGCLLDCNIHDLQKNHTYIGCDTQISRMRGEEQKHLNEMINLLGTEVIRRLEAEKTVEALTQLLAQFSSPCSHVVVDPNLSSKESQHRERLSSANIIEGPEGNCSHGVQRDVFQTEIHKYDENVSSDQILIPTDADDRSVNDNVELFKLREEMVLLQEEKGVVEAALDMEIMNNKQLRMEITSLKNERPGMHSPEEENFGDYREQGHNQTPRNQIEEVCMLEEKLAINQVEMEYAKKYVYMFSEETLGLMLQVGAIVDDLKVN